MTLNGLSLEMIKASDPYGENKMNILNELKKEDLTLTEIWNTLSIVECKQLDKKGNFTYMSWGVCWLMLMKYYPFAEYEFLQTQYYDNGTAEVHCKVSIGKHIKLMHLPVMDFNNNSIKNPTSRQINDSKMRCMVKCIAMYGLGHYIFSNKESAFYGEDLPDQKKDKEEKSVVSNKYSLVTPDGEDLGIYVGEDDLLRELKAKLGVKKADQTEEHNEFFRANMPTIKQALDNVSQDDQNHSKLNRLVGFYADIWATRNDQKES